MFTVWLLSGFSLPQAQATTNAWFNFSDSQSEWKLKISHKSKVRANEKWKRKSRSRQWKFRDCRDSLSLAWLLLGCLRHIQWTKNLENLSLSLVQTPIECARAFWCVTKPTRIQHFSAAGSAWSFRLGLAEAGYVKFNHRHLRHRKRNKTLDLIVQQWNLHLQEFLEQFLSNHHMCAEFLNFFLCLIYFFFFFGES